MSLTRFVCQAPPSDFKRPVAVLSAKKWIFQVTWQPYTLLPQWATLTLYKTTVPCQLVAAIWSSSSWGTPWIVPQPMLTAQLTSFGTQAGVYLLCKKWMLVKLTSKSFQPVGTTTTIKGAPHLINQVAQPNAPHWSKRRLFKLMTLTSLESLKECFGSTAKVRMYLFSCQFR